MTWSAFWRGGNAALKANRWPLLLICIGTFLLGRLWGEAYHAGIVPFPPPVPTRPW
jgi:hypothetical protein